MYSPELPPGFFPRRKRLQLCHRLFVYITRPVQVPIPGGSERVALPSSIIFDETAIGFRYWSRPLLAPICVWNWSSETSNPRLESHFSLYCRITEMIIVFFNRGPSGHPEGEYCKLSGIHRALGVNGVWNFVGTESLFWGDLGPKGIGAKYLCYKWE